MSMEFVRTTRQTLIQRLKDPKDDAAWADFYQFYWEIISGWARRQGCTRTQAQDIFQETMICLLRRMQSFDYDPARGSFKAFLKSIVRSRVIDYFRKEGRYVAASVDDEGNDQIGRLRDEDAGSSSGPELSEDRIWVKSILNQALRQAYKKIDQVTYKSFCLYVLDGLPVEEVSRRLDNLRPGTIYQQKSRFLKLVEKEFTDLLAELEEAEAGPVRSGPAFIKVVEEMVQNKPEYRETIILDFADKQDFSNIELCRQALQISPWVTDRTSLLVVDAENVRQAYRIEPVSQLAIGKNEKCDIVLDSDKISGLHATLLCNNSGCSIKDENSANGIFVNSRRINGQHELNDGDIISFSGRHLVLFSHAPE